MFPNARLVIISCLSSQGDLQQFIDDRDLFIRAVGEIMIEFNLQQPPSTQAPQDSRTLRPEDNDGDNKWVRIFGDKNPLDRRAETSGGITICEPWYCSMIGWLRRRVVGLLCVSCCVCVSFCTVSVWVDELKYSVAMASALSTGEFFTARAGLGSPWVARRNSIHTIVLDYLIMNQSAPLLTVSSAIYCVSGSTTLPLFCWNL